MTSRKTSTVLLLWLTGALHSAPVPADTTLRVAVASNFATTAERIGTEFHAATGLAPVFSSASTGKHYAQIINGAPFDVFLAADSLRPKLLEDRGLVVSGSRFTYAEGRLVAWSRRDRSSSGNCRELLTGSAVRRVAIANPRTAPYGVAARETLVALAVWDSLQDRLALGENIAQALQFAASGNADIGLVAASQIATTVLPQAGCLWRVPREMHAPIRQQAVVLQRAADHPSARRFLAFLREDAARAIIAEHGYDTPAATENQGP